jgi:magnesium-transporting ATPase (P-type)
MTTTEETNILARDSDISDDEDDHIVIGHHMRDSRHSVFLMILSFLIFGLLCIAWYGMAYIHYTFNTYGDYDDVIHWFQPTIICTYVTMGVFAAIWLSTMCTCCYNQHFVKTKTTVLLLVSIASFVVAIPIKFIDHDHPDYDEFKQGVFISTLTQMFCVFYFAILLYRYHGRIPVFCDVYANV